MCFLTLLLDRGTTSINALRSTKIVLRMCDRDIILEYVIQQSRLFESCMTIAKSPSQKQPLLIDVSNTTLHSAEQLEQLQSDNPDLQIELTEDGKLIVMPPSKSEWMETATAGAVALLPANNSVPDLISSSTYQLPELTPEETARRLAMVERRIERERQEWDSFTPKQKAEHDRQFEDLYESLAKSRK
jgi:hypothetical protein